MTRLDRIDYVELAATDMSAAKAFYRAVFGWKFEDYGPDYASFKEGRLAGGLTTQRQPAKLGAGTLIVFLADDLRGTQKRVVVAGGKVTTELFEFPGGQRFHFSDPSGNELAVWAPLEQSLDNE